MGLPIILGKKTKEVNYKYALKRFNTSKRLLILFLPCFIYMLIFRYLPIWGILISFKNYSVFKGFSGSPWVGFENFTRFFASPMAFKLIKNTFLLSLFSIAWGISYAYPFCSLSQRVKRLKKQKNTTDD